MDASTAPCPCLFMVSPCRHVVHSRVQVNYLGLFILDIDKQTQQDNRSQYCDGQLGHQTDGICLATKL